MQLSTFRQRSTERLSQEALLQFNGCWARLHNKIFFWCPSSTTLVWTTSMRPRTLPTFSRNDFKLASPSSKPTLTQSSEEPWTRSSTRVRTRCWSDNAAGTGAPKDLDISRNQNGVGTHDVSHKSFPTMVERWWFNGWCVALHCCDAHQHMWDRWLRIPEHLFQSAQLMLWRIWKNSEQDQRHSSETSPRTPRTWSLLWKIFSNPNIHLLTEFLLTISLMGMPQQNHSMSLKYVELSAWWCLTCEKSERGLLEGEKATHHLSCLWCWNILKHLNIYLHYLKRNRHQRRQELKNQNLRKFQFLTVPTSMRWWSTSSGLCGHFTWLSTWRLGGCWQPVRARRDQDGFCNPRTTPRRDQPERAHNVSQREQIIEAKKKELQSFFKNTVWKFGDDSKGSLPHDRVVTAPWVLTWKPPQPGSNVPRAKPRLVLRGYQDPDLFNLEKNSPTAGRSGKLVLLTLAAILKWLVWCGDVKAAFLSGAKFIRELLVQLPRDCGPLLGYTSQQPVHMRMLKSAYGLADAPLLCFKEATRRLRNLKLVPQQIDKCTFAYYYYSDTGELTGQIIESLKKDFEFGKWEELTPQHEVTYCSGGVIQRTSTTIEVSYKKELQKICPITVPKQRNTKEKLNSAETTKCRGLLGALQWPGGQGVLPLCATTSLLAGELPTGDGTVIQNLNKALRFGKETANNPLKFQEIVSNIKDLAIICFCDAAFGVRTDLASQGGYLVVATDRRTLKGEKCRYSPLARRSFKLPRVCRSSLSAESQAMASALEETFMLKMFLKMLFKPQLNVKDAQDKLDMPTAIVTECKALYDLIQREGDQSSLDKRVAIEALVIKDLIKQVQGQLRWVSSERQLADGLMKIRSRQQFSDALKSGWLQLVDDTSFTPHPRRRQSGARSFQGINDFKDCFGDCGLGERRDADGIRRHWGQRLVAADLLHDVCLHPDHRQGGLVDDEIEPYHIETQSLERHELTEMSEMRHACIHRDVQISSLSDTLQDVKEQAAEVQDSYVRKDIECTDLTEALYVQFKVNEITTSCLAWRRTPTRDADQDHQEAATTTSSRPRWTRAGSSWGASRHPQSRIGWEELSMWGAVPSDRSSRTRTCLPAVNPGAHALPGVCGHRARGPEQSPKQQELVGPTPTLSLQCQVQRCALRHVMEDMHYIHWCRWCMAQSGGTNARTSHPESKEAAPPVP